MTEQSDKPSVDGLMNLVSEFGQMRWSEGSTGATYLDRAGERRAREEAADTYVEIRAYAERLASLAGPLEQPQEPTSDQANLAQASGGEASKTARPASHDVTTCPYFSMYLDLSEASGYPHEKDTMVSPEEYGAALLKDAERYRWLREWLVRNSLLYELYCKPPKTPLGDYWILRRPAVINGDGVEGVATTADAAIDAAREARVEPVEGFLSEPLTPDKPAASSESSVSVLKEQQ